MELLNVNDQVCDVDKTVTLKKYIPEVFSLCEPERYSINQLQKQDDLLPAKEHLSK